MEGKKNDFHKSASVGLFWIFRASHRLHYLGFAAERSNMGRWAWKRPSHRFICTGVHSTPRRFLRSTIDPALYVASRTAAQLVSTLGSSSLARAADVIVSSMIG